MQHLCSSSAQPIADRRADLIPNQMACMRLGCRGKNYKQITIRHGKMQLKQCLILFASNRIFVIASMFPYSLFHLPCPQPSRLQQYVRVCVCVWAKDIRTKRMRRRWWQKWRDMQFEIFGERKTRVDVLNFSFSCHRRHRPQCAQMQTHDFWG